MPNSRRLVSLLISTVCVFGATFAAAQDFPTKPIRFIVPNNPGTTADLVARIMAPEMSKFLGQPGLVENKPGADATIGYEYVASQVPADGYTIAVAFVEGLATLPLTNKNLRFDPLKDLPPISGLVLSSSILASSSNLPWTTVDGMVAYAKANPGKFNYGSSSPNVLLPTLALIQGFGIDAIHIPYGGGGIYINAIGSGEIHMGLLSEGSVTTLGKRLRILAVSGKKLHAKYPDVPTLAELGYPQIQGNNASLNVRLGTPPATIAKLHMAASRALQQPETIARFDKVQFEIVNETPDAAAQKLREIAKVFADIAKKVGIQPK